MNVDCSSVAYFEISGKIEACFEVRCEAERMLVFIGHDEPIAPAIRDAIAKVWAAAHGRTA